MKMSEGRPPLSPSPETRAFFVVGATHIDLAWKRGPAEMAEMLEIFVVRLLDALDREPDFRYMIEQAAHYRTLKKTRPDLIDRLKRYVGEGRLEMAGGMASTLETNLPNGESFVRNQGLGMAWARENLGVAIKTGWLIDTFGVHAQTPQILKQFGIRHLMANRFGGAAIHDIFRARGLDGTEVLVVGRDTYSAFVRSENTARVFYQNWDGVDRLFREADELPGDGPLLLIPYVENEYLLSLRPLRLAEERNAARTGETYQLATPGDYFAALDAATEKSGRQWPVIHGDLNPEFTGCFSLRPTIRLRNRQTETLLLEAEKWASLLGLTGWEDAIEEAWWRMAFLQFHDIFTGSHPTAVFREVMQGYDDVEKIGQDILSRALETLLPAPVATNGEIVQTALAVNGLPWERRDVVCVATAAPVARVTDANNDPVPFEQSGGELRFPATLPAVGAAAFFLYTDASAQAAPIVVAETSATDAVIENEYIRLEADAAVGIRRLLWKPTGAVLIENAGDFLVAQCDKGTFQIEAPDGAEVAAIAPGPMRLTMDATSPIGQTLRLSGAFPRLSWAGDNNHLTWEAEFRLTPGKPQLNLTVRLDWKGEASRLRLKLATLLNSSDAVFEVPFGTVRRKPYGVRGNARGEWPAHRFVAIEDGAHGLALANTGVGGVETAGGTIWTTLLRAPKAADIGMVPDDTSSQHGAHTFTFALIPYAATDGLAGVVARAQELNNPFRAVLRAGKAELTPSPPSRLSLDADHVVLSAVKTAGDETGDLIVRVYETLGQTGSVGLTVHGATGAWRSDLREERGDAIPCQNNRVRFPVEPYEIKTLRFARGGV